MASNNEAPQPQQANILVIPCPAGLEPLINVEKLFVNKGAGERHFDFQKHYDILTESESGARIYHVTESTDPDPMADGNPNVEKPHTLFVLDSTGRAVLCIVGLDSFFGTPAEADLYYFGFKFGPIKQTSGYKWGCGLKFDVLNSENQVVLRIVSTQSECCTGRCGQGGFKVLSVDGLMEIGKISRVWLGLCTEMCTYVDNLRVQMPADLDIQIKALIMCTTLMLDLLYFNRPRGRRVIPNNNNI